MSLVPRRVHGSLLVAIAAAAAISAACAPFGASAPASSAGTSAAPPVPASSSADASVAASDAAASQGGTGSAAAGGSATSSGVWLPDWADASVPEAVANRRPLRFCGVEKPPAPQPMVFVDPNVRLCFDDAARNGEEAEWVSIQGTMEGGTVATIYRVLRDGTVEVLTDWTQDPFGGGGWTRMACREVIEAEGDELVGVDGCDEGVRLM